MVEKHCLTYQFIKYIPSPAKLQAYTAQMVQDYLLPYADNIEI